MKRIATGSLVAVSKTNINAVQTIAASKKILFALFIAIDSLSRKQAKSFRRK